MVSFVNGYLCTSSCDEAKAKRGVDPHPKADPTQADGKPDKSDQIKPASAVDDLAVVFGGALAGVAGLGPVANGATPSARASLQATALLVDFLA